jgi:predicted nucleic acid-binding Zn ribbon protein
MKIEKICEYCNKPYIADRRTQRFCSETCSNKWHHQNRPNKKYLKSYICKYCGEPFIPKAADRTTFCSRDCAFKYKAEQKAKRLKEREIQKEYKRICAVCGKSFTSKTNQKYCSKKCLREKERIRAKQQAKEKYQIREPLICKECGKPFIPEYPSKRRKFCSDDCRRKYQSRKNRKSIKGKIRKFKERHKRRANLNKVKYENINPIKVYESHNWICGICGKKINPKLKCPHPKSASIDHIVPISKGGTHTYDNVQPAHFICNSFKGDSIENIQLKLCQTA